MNWVFPLRKSDYTYPIPQDPKTHLGAFGAIRRHDVHTGVDLYCKQGTPVYAIEDGQVVAIEIFTGPRAESPWWNETLAILVEGESGVVCYGEVDNRWMCRSTKEKASRGEDIGIQDILDIRKMGVHQRGVPYLKVGDHLNQGDLVSWTKQVLKKDKGRPMCMLHFELYNKGTQETVWWGKDEPQPSNLLNPTSFLLNAFESN